MKISAIKTAAFLALLPIFAFASAASAETLAKRGEYLVKIMDCNGCHTPGALVGQPDMSKYLTGSNIGFHIPDYGYVYGPNLTPDEKTGLGKWSVNDIVKAVRTGVRPDGRQLVVMPWPSFAKLTDRDARAIATYLKSLPPVANAAPPMTGDQEKAPAPYLDVVAPK